MQNLIQRLEKRGWGKKEIAEAAWLIRKSKESIDPEARLFQRRIYRILLAAIVVANFAISTALMPLLIALKGIFLYFILVVMGLSFGLLFELVIRSAEHLERRHHIVLAAFIPIVAVVNAFVISGVSNDLARNLGLGNVHNPLIIAVVYAASFVLPYIIYRFVFLFFLKLQSA